jgi:hypothetical protein
LVALFFIITWKPWGKNKNCRSLKCSACHHITSDGASWLQKLVLLNQFGGKHLLRQGSFEQERKIDVFSLILLLLLSKFYGISKVLF